MAPAGTAQGSSASTATADGCDLSGPLTATFFGVFQRMRQISARRAAEHDMSLTQVRALYALREPLSMRELADRLFLDPSNLTTLVDRLEVLGLVERTADAGDRRIKRLVITAKGSELADTIVAAVFDESPVFGVLGLPEQRALLELLQRLMEAPEL
jgi:DNA-binding MarR family transcriptional regulator